jgi:hypothetical protein
MLVVLGGLWSPSPAAVTSAPVVTQPANAAALLETTATALDSVQSVRFSTSFTVTNVYAPAGPDPNAASTIATSGEFRAPDRYRFVYEPEADARIETIMIGQVWGRVGDRPWQDGPPGALLSSAGVAPAQLAAVLRELPVYLTAPDLRQVGSDVVLISPLDLARLEEDQQDTWLLGGPYGQGGSQFPTVLASAEVALVVDSTTGWLRTFSTRARYVPETPPLPAGLTFPEGFTPSVPTAVQITTTVRLFDYDDPSIQIEPPL